MHGSAASPGTLIGRNEHAAGSKKCKARAKSAATSDRKRRLTASRLDIHPPKGWCIPRRAAGVRPNRKRLPAPAGVSDHFGRQGAGIVHVATWAQRAVVGDPYWSAIGRRFGKSSCLRMYDMRQYQTRAWHNIPPHMGGSKAIAGSDGVTTG